MQQLAFLTCLRHCAARYSCRCECIFTGRLQHVLSCGGNKTFRSARSARARAGDATVGNDVKGICDRCWQVLSHALSVRSPASVVFSKSLTHRWTDGQVNYLYWRTGAVRCTSIVSSRWLAIVADSAECCRWCLLVHPTHRPHTGYDTIGYD